MALLKGNTQIYGTANVQSVLVVGNITPNNSISVNTGSLQVTGGAGITGNVYANAIYTSGLFYSSNGNPWVTGGGGGSGSGSVVYEQDSPPSTPNPNDFWLANTGILYQNFGNTTFPVWAETGPSAIAITTTGGGGGGGVSASGFLANSIIFANSTGYLSNTSNIKFYSSNNNLFVSGSVYAGGVLLTGGGGGSGSGSVVYEQDLPPSTPNPNDFWLANTGTLYQNFGNTTYPSWAETGPNLITANTSPGIVTGTDVYAGSTNLLTAINTLLPTQTGQSGNYLSTNGTQTQWVPPPLDPIVSALIFGH